MEGCLVLSHILNFTKEDLNTKTPSFALLMWNIAFILSPLQ